MLIVCPSCASEYTIDSATLGADGRTVRCAICRDTWFAAPERIEGQSEPTAEQPGAVLLRTGAAGAPRTGRRLRRPLLMAGAALSVLALALPVMGRERLRAAEALVRDALLGPARPAFRDLVSEIVGPQADRSLVVSGEVVNGTDRTIGLDPLEFLVRNGDEQVLVAWTRPPPQPRLRPGEAARFEARLPEPPAEGRDVRVHFTRARGAALAALTDWR